MIGKIQGYLQAIVALHTLLGARCFVIAQFGGEFKEAPGLAESQEDLGTLYYQGNWKRGPGLVPACAISGGAL
jgi:hypothetical protein